MLLVVGARLGAQSDRPRPAIVVVNLRFDGEHANVLSAGDTAVVAAATSKLLATLRASELVTVVDSSAVAAAGATAEDRGEPCDNQGALAVGRPLGARWAAEGT